MTPILLAMSPLVFWPLEISLVVVVLMLAVFLRMVEPDTDGESAAAFIFLWGTMAAVLIGAVWLVAGAIGLVQLLARAMSS